jgi:hypothetical protein
MPGSVFILGAGASMQAGAPLMWNFLDVAENLLRSRKLKIPEDKMHFERVFRGVAALQGVYAKATIDSDNLESVYSAFELADLLGRLGDLEITEVSLLPQSLRRLIVATLEHTIEFPFDGRNAAPPVPYDGFVQLLQKLAEKDHGEQTTIITFNYDLALDYALYVRNVEYDYCLEGDVSAGSVRLLKLHGSTNWVPSKDKNQIHAWNLSEYFRAYHWNRTLERGQKTKLMISAQLSEYCESRKDKDLAADSVIVPPTSSKVQHYRQIRNVWSSASKALADAENIFVAGYSLPATDTFFRYLFALGSISSTRLKRFWVYDPDKSGSVKDRFQSLLGPTTMRRFRFESLTFGGTGASFSSPSAISDYREALKL